MYALDLAWNNPCIQLSEFLALSSPKADVSRGALLTDGIFMVVFLFCVSLVFIFYLICTLFVCICHFAL